MMITRLRALPLLVGLLLVPLPGLAQENNDPAEGLTYLTEEFRPLNFAVDGRPNGLAVALLKMLWQQMDVPQQPIHVMPWVRIYNSLQMDARIVAFPLYRTSEREPAFKWVGPIVKGRLVLYALRSPHFKIHSLDDVAGRTVASLRDIAAAEKVSGAGVQLTYASRPEHAVQMLASRRVDAVALDEFRFRRTIQAMRLSPEAFEAVWVFSEDALYYAFSKDTPDALIARFQRALDAIKGQPTYRNLLNFYIN